MVVSRVIQLIVLPGVKHYSNRWIHAKETDALSSRTHTCADRLQRKNNTVGTIRIFATKVYIEYKIKGCIQVNFVSVPDAATL